MRRMVVLLVLSLVCASLIAMDGGRFALVMGNGDYRGIPRLFNPVNDATDLARLLEEVGFSVRLETDATLSRMENAVREFAATAKAARAEMTLFFYAGHGVRYEGMNYLIPLDADIHKEYELRNKALSMEMVLAALEDVKSQFNLILLDAYHENPFATTRGDSRDLAVMDGGTSESMVVFATAPGSVAQDGEGGNSPFTTALKQHLATPDLEVRQLVAAVSRSVQTMTKGQQVPWVNTSFTGEFFFVTAQQQLARADVEAQRLQGELAALESEITRLQTAMASETDGLAVQRLQIEQQRIQTLEMAKRLESQRMEEMRTQAENLLSLQSRDLAAKRELDTRLTGEQETLALQAAQRRAEMERLELQRVQSSGAKGRLESIARAELAVPQIKDSFGVSIANATRELADMKIKLVDSYKITNPRDPWETVAEFNARVTKYSGELDVVNAAKIKEMEKRRDAEVLAIGLAQMKSELNSMRFTIGSTVVVSAFDAENKRFPMKAVATVAGLSLETSFYYKISSSVREVLQREYQRIDNADKAKSLVGEMTYAVKEVSPGIWSARIVSLRILNLLEGSTDNPGLVVSFPEGANPLEKEVFFQIKDGVVHTGHTVSFDSAGGSAVSALTGVMQGARICEPRQPVKSSHVFDGWYKDSGLINRWDFAKDAVTTDMKLYAKWKAGYSVGSAGPAGGIIFYDKGSYSDGWRYLEAAPESTEWEDKVWGGIGTSVRGTGTGIGSGKGNTEKIVAKYGNAEPYGKKTDYAAKLCADLVHGAFSDWFLPSRDELNLMYTNLYKKNIGGFADSYYWSSSEYSSSTAWFQGFYNGNQANSFGKNGNYFRVRAVRAF